MKQAIYLILFLFMIATTSSEAQEKTANFNILAFSKTAGYRHGAIPQSLVALGQLAEQNNWKITATEEAEIFNPKDLKAFDLVVFVHTTKDILEADQQEALKNYIETGGGLLALHTGADTEYEWPWYAEAIGASFVGHPPSQEGKLIIEDRSHPATEHFPESTWIVTDEWYSFDRNPRENVHVLISIDESSYDVDDDRWFEGAKQRMGDHPLVWYKEVGEGKVFQTALGHEPGLYHNPIFLKHLEGAVLWTAKRD
ncbi:ThuA domain-containing protein [Marinilabilia sp.]|uniref:ThuA domain-containing protein n=1 Tax=Marinilabilia sp. TaxID=2021252 RepID=UPI0025C5BA79|nr:ThuA domain-containing protein [Marinilabilia sp.]